jgi:hypothetical protein
MSVGMLRAVTYYRAQRAKERPREIERENPYADLEDKRHESPEQQRMLVETEAWSYLLFFRGRYPPLGFEQFLVVYDLVAEYQKQNPPIEQLAQSAENPSWLTSVDPE